MPCALRYARTRERQLDLRGGGGAALGVHPAIDR
jgi:hypothetical protein